MKREQAEKLFTLLGEIDDEIIAEAEAYNNKSAPIMQFPQKRRIARLMMIAASVGFVAVSVWGIGQLGMQGDENLVPEYDVLMEADDADIDGDWDVEDAAEEADEDGWEDDGEELLFEDRRVDFIHQLTEDELSAVFPSIDADISAVALFLNDGSLIEVEAIVKLPTSEQVILRVAEGMIERTIINVAPDEPSIRDINGIEVSVYESAAASFMLDNIAYYVEFFDEDIIDQIILGGAADLSVFDDMTFD